MSIDRDLQYAIYNAGVTEGRSMIGDWLGSNPDLLEMAASNISSPDNHRRIMRSSDNDAIKAVKNYHDGLEDGVKQQLQKELRSYLKWLKEEA